VTSANLSARGRRPALAIAAAYGACGVIWGTTYYAIRVCIGPGGYPTLLASALRFIIAALLLAAVCALGLARPGPRAAQLAWLGVAGLLNTAGYSCVYIAEESLTSGLAAVVFATLPLMTAVVAGLTGVERPTLGSVLAALVGLGGVVIILWDRLQVSRVQAVGVALVLGAVLMATLYNIVVKRHAAGVHPLAANAAFLGATALGTSLLALAAERQAPPWPPAVGPTLALLYLAVLGSVVAFAGYFYLISRVRLMTLATLTLVQPLVSLVVDALWESEPIGPRGYAGAAVTLAGLLLHLAWAARRQAP
jgi:drug/metabolite transporter (DMT)-like permease